MDANESFEKAAKAFEKATGKLMPGKDVGSAWPGEEWEEERQHEFKIWCAAVEYMRVVTTAKIKVDGLEATLEKLSPTEKDILLIKTEIPLGPETLQEICDMLPSTKILLLNLPEGSTVETLDESEMNAHGWYKGGNA